MLQKGYYLFLRAAETIAICAELVTAFNVGKVGEMGTRQASLFERHGARARQDKYDILTRHCG
jgi:hypothetical protein